MRSPEVLNEKSRAMPIFGCSRKVTLVLLGDHHFEIRIGSKGWVGQAQV
jgi:hypothetical protein